MFSRGTLPHNVVTLNMHEKLPVQEDSTNASYICATRARIQVWTFIGHLDLQGNANRYRSSENVADIDDEKASLEKSRGRGRQKLCVRVTKKVHTP